MTKKTIFKRGSWEPIVQDDGQQLILFVPIASGHLSFSIEFSVTDQDLRVLRENEERYYFLFAYLHRKYQMHPKRSLLQDDDIGLILHGPRHDVENLLTKADKTSNGAISNHASKTLVMRQDNMFNKGIWFSR